MLAGGYAVEEILKVVCAALCDVELVLEVLTFLEDIGENGSELHRLLLTLVGGGGIGSVGVSVSFKRNERSGVKSQ